MDKIDLDKTNYDNVSGITSTSHYFHYGNEKDKIVQTLKKIVIETEYLVMSHQFVSQFIYKYLLHKNIIDIVQHKTLI